MIYQYNIHIITYCHPVLRHVESYKSVGHQEVMLKLVAKFHPEAYKKVTS